jgi:hypothetical protein
MSEAEGSYEEVAKRTALIDGDIIRYEIGFAAEAGWRAITGDPEALPPWSFVEEILHNRLAVIMHAVKATDMKIYLTDGKTFRDKLAVTRPYKGTRPSKKPWHFQNLTVVLVNCMGAEIVYDIEADDAMAIEQTRRDDTIIVSRDKDLRQVPGWYYSWELGNQPSFGPARITKYGHLVYDPEKRKLSGTGLSFFYAQMLMGDTTDNIPGLKGVGPKAAFDILDGVPDAELLTAVTDAYQAAHPDNWFAYMTEQGQLLWMTRHLNSDGTPVLYEIGREA